MAIISQETWDYLIPEEEKEKIREEYNDNRLITPNDKYQYERLFGTENLQRSDYHKIKTWDDIKNLKLIDETLEEQLGALSYWNKETKAICDKCSATLKIAKLIELGYGGMITEEEWNDGNVEKVSIIYIPFGKECFDIYHNSHRKEFITFHSKRQAEEFMSYPENRALVEQYHMV